MQPRIERINLEQPQQLCTRYGPSRTKCHDAPLKSNPLPQRQLAFCAPHPEVIFLRELFMTKIGRHPIFGSRVTALPLQSFSLRGTLILRKHFCTLCNQPPALLTFAKAPRLFNLVYKHQTSLLISVDTVSLYN